VSTSPELLQVLAAIDAAGGRVSIVDGRVRIDVEVELPDAVWDTLKAHREELRADLAGDRQLWDETEPVWRDHHRDTLPPPAGVDRCDRCRSTETVDQPIHGGASVRRDCAACGRFRAFTRWHGVVMPLTQSDSQLAQHENCSDARPYP
jgi:hypothetical protein